MDAKKHIEIINKALQIHFLVGEIRDLLEDGDPNIWGDLRMADDAAMHINNKLMDAEID